MIITAANPPGPAGYPLLKEAGINTVWGGDPEGAKLPLACQEHELHYLPDGSRIWYYVPSVIGQSMGEDVPIAQLPMLERKITAGSDLHGSVAFCSQPNEPVFPVLVSATYTRLLDHLGVESIEEYYEKFAELAPSATPMLCHYYWHRFSGHDVLVGNPRAAFDYNLRLMHTHFKTWWAWVQVTAHEHYAGEWEFLPVSSEQIQWQVQTLVDHGCSGIGYFTWKPLGDADGIVGKDENPSRHFETVRRINELL